MGTTRNLAQRISIVATLVALRGGTAVADGVGLLTIARQEPFLRRRKCATPRTVR